jgi:hypothetical protein
VKARAVAALRVVAAILAALFSPQIVAAALLIGGIALVGEAVRMLAGPGYALLTWGVALIALAVIVMRGASRG